MSIGLQIFGLVILAIPVAAISWTLTHENLFREFHDRVAEKSRTSPRLLQRKFFYLFTCEFCLSHWVTLAFLLFTRFRLLLDDWRGYVIAFFSLVWIANHYMSLYARLRLDVKRERVEIAKTEREESGRDDEREDE